MFQPIVVAAAILNDLSQPTQVLGAQRSYPEQWRGFYEFPGGKTEPGETPEQALRRELREELSAEIIVGERLQETWSAHGGFQMFVYLCALAPHSTLQVGVAHLSLHWVDLKHSESLPWLPADYPILTAIARHFGIAQN
ncbi:(deoxy)nucleoside triphosphate pyrophosphohydrolase [Mobiluncus curtisii]|uniref:(deoxy)nucleoside triphosphate pyrophosphohydrolase n=1 Tax=Mobiluncus curtisii TaxID=2051 RepID=UPI0014703862|nr:NUDIX domain-containing protein [Mobiluncus curtisii]NMW44751.1 NUDIX domain-containing protein [Mobiluncus curtisii]